MKKHNKILTCLIVVSLIAGMLTSICASAFGVEEIILELLGETIVDCIKTGDFTPLFFPYAIPISTDPTPEQLQDCLDAYNHNLQEQKELVGASQPSAYDVHYEQYDYYDNHVYFTLDRTFIVNWVTDTYDFDLTGYNIFCAGQHVLYNNRRNLSDGQSAIDYFYVYLFPENASVYYSDDGTNFTISGPWRTNVPHKTFSIQLSCTPNLDAYCSRYGYMVDRSQEVNITGSLDTIFVNDLTEQPLTFTSSITITGNDQLVIMLDSSRPVDVDLFGFGGILYDDGTERYDGTDRGFINGEYVNAKSLQGGQHWEWQYDIDEFSNWAYRKRILDLDCFYGFVAVYNDDECIYSNESKLGLSDPSDIFDDVTPLPPWSDYAPTIPALPTLTPVTFDYSSGDTFYNISNYSGNDFDFSSFFGWFNGAFVAMANNMAAFFANAEAFFNAVAEFSLDGIIDAFGYIGDLIGDLEASLNGNFNSFGQYFGDLQYCLDHNMQMLFDNLHKDITNNYGDINGYITDMSSTINSNLETIIDNLEQIAENQLEPDKVYIDWLLQHAMPWYGQIRNALNSHTFETDSLSLTIDFGTVLGEYTYNFTNATIATKIRDILTMILYASTVVGCGRIGFQIFGIDISKGKGGE